MINSNVEIIMPAYNAEKTIEKAIQGIIDQSFKDWSLIVADDASTDRTKDLLINLALLDSRIIVLDTGKNSGVSAARNTALNFIGGNSYVAYCDSDDVWEPDHLEISLAFLNLGADIVYNNPKFIDENQNEVFPNFPLYNNFSLDNLRKGNFIWISSVVHRGKIGLFDSELDSTEDYDLWIRAAKQGLKFKQHNNKTVTYLVKTSGMATKGIQTLNKLRTKHRDFVTTPSGSKLKKYSIIIPTAFDHLESDLKPCLESIAKYTDLSEAEVIVVSNGATDNTDEYVRSLGDDYKLLTYPEALGYAKACNKGLEVAEGQYIVLLNNDCILLNQPKNHWLDILEEPFKYDPAAGVVGPLKGPSEPAGHDFIIFFCVMIKKELVDKLKLSEDYGVGGGEDTEYCIEAEKLGYKVIQFPAEKPMPSSEEKLMLGYFPIYHKGEATMDRLPEWQSIFNQNFLTLAKKYNPDYYKFKLSNQYERAVIDNKENLDGYPREVSRYQYAAKNVKGKKVLEIGCSSGYGLRFLPSDIDYTGLDYDKTIIEFAKENFAAPNRKFLHGDIHDFEFKEHYDTIIAYEVIEHLTDGKEIAQKLKQHCDTLLISTPYREIPGMWGHHHRIHNITEKDFPDFEYTFLNLNGIFLPEPDCFDGRCLLLMKWEKGKSYSNKVFTPPETKPEVLAFIPTKNRYGPLAMTIQSIALQTVTPDRILIYDDGESKDLREDPVFKHLFRLLDLKNIKWSVIFGKKEGQHHGHEIANTSGATYVWRIDDDEVAEPDVLEKLLALIQDPSVGAVGGAVIIPGEETAGGTSKIGDIYSSPNIQWSRANKAAEVDHLYSSFLYRAGIVHYELGLSPVAHREETIFSYKLKDKGYRLLFTPEAVTYHFRHDTGGIRDNAKKDFFIHDETLFKGYLESTGIKVIRENGGLGDNLILRNDILQLLLKKYKHVILGTCYTNVFQDIKAPNMTLIPVGAIPEVPTDNIYAWAAYMKWNKSFGEAYKKFYGVE